MDTEICANCSRLKGKNVDIYFVQVDCHYKKVMFYNKNTGDVLCEPNGMVSQLKFKLYGGKALYLYEHPSDCPFHFEHVVFDVNERDKYLGKNCYEN